MLFGAAYAGETFGGCHLTHDEISQLITLSQRCQGWWMWSKDERRKFVTLDVWSGFYSQWYQSR